MSGDVSKRLGPAVLVLEAQVGGKMWMTQGNLQKETITNIVVEKVFDQITPIGVRLYRTSQQNRRRNGEIGGEPFSDFGLLIFKLDDEHFGSDMGHCHPKVIFQ
jgi:hypothetical protein